MQLKLIILSFFFIFVKCNSIYSFGSSNYRSAFYETQSNPITSTNKLYTSPSQSPKTTSNKSGDLSKNPYLSKSYSNIPYTNNSFIGRSHSSNNNYSPSSSSTATTTGNHQNIIVQPKPHVYNKPNNGYTPPSSSIHRLSTYATTTSTTTTTTTTPIPLSNLISNKSPSTNYEVTNLDSAYSSPTVYNSNFTYKCEYNEQPKLPVMNEVQRDYSIVAKIHKSGFMGYVLFTISPNQGYLNQDNISVKVHITNSRTQLGQPIKDAFSWRIYNQHSIDSNGGCALFLNSDDLLHDLTINFGPIITGKPQSFASEEFSSSVLQSLPLGKQAKQGLNGLLGKTIMLIGVESGIKICTTLLPAGVKQVYEAKLHFPVSGRFKFVQGTGLNQLAILTEYLMYSNGERKESKHRWQIVDANSQPLDYKHNHEKIFAERFHNEKTNCADLKGKFVLSSNEINEYNHLVVNTEMPTLRGRSSHVISTIKPLSSYNSLYLIVYEQYNSDKILACAPINLKRPITSSATFKYPPILGTISFAQETPLDQTQVHINLNFTSPTAYFYGIDALPSIKRRKPEMKKCPNIKETIFNPLRLDIENIPFEGQGTSDQYAVGDLSGKFCSLTYPSNLNNNNFKSDGVTPIKTLNLYSTDYNLPLFGKNSIIGRALVFYDLEGNAVSCSNIELLGGIINTAYSTFDQPIQGQLIFRQSANYCDDEVFVYIEISKPDQLNSARTDNHAWHIHENPVKTGFETLSTQNCDAAGGHHNPYGVSIDATYLRDCNSVTPERCERGDTSSKLSPISIVPYKPVVFIENDKKVFGDAEVSKYYNVDNQLSLCGPNSIIGKSIVIHDKHFSVPRLSCSNILEFKTKN